MKNVRSLKSAGALACAALALFASAPIPQRTVEAAASDRSDKLMKINHFVVIYQENHSFDNLYGGWEGVNGRANATDGQKTQVNQSGAAYTCLKQDDPNLTSPPMTSTCHDVANSIDSAFANAPFNIDAYIPATAVTCGNPAICRISAGS